VRPRFRLIHTLQIIPRTPQADWWAIDRAVVEQLLAEDLGSVVNSLAQSPSGDAAELMRQLDLRVRAGHRRRAAEVIDRLAEATDLPEKGTLSHLADFLIGREEWELSRQLLERLPQAEPGWGYVMIKRWAERGDPEEIDRWLAARAEQNAEYWFGERLRFRAGRGTEGAWFDSLAEEVRHHPADLARAQRYLRAVSTVGKKMDLDWMGEVCQPALAYECYLLGEDLARLSPRAAVLLLNRSLALPFSAQDRKLLDESLRYRSAISFQAVDWEKELRTSTKLALARSYKAVGQADKAQPIVEELTAAGKDGLPPRGLSQFAGQVQLQSGARVVESRIARAEAQNTNSSEYWLTRAEYYAGRKEQAQAIEAYERALELSPLDAEGRGGDQRYQVWSAYAWFLGSAARSREAGQLWRREFDAARPETEYARRLPPSATGAGLAPKSWRPTPIRLAPGRWAG
jgi:tetratricopeptide (TPR) repeat protein